MVRSESALTCTREVHVLSPLKEVLKRVRGDLFSMQRDVVSSEITGRATGSQIGVACGVALAGSGHVNYL
jgi:hypothetical protein